MKQQERSLRTTQVRGIPGHLMMVGLCASILSAWASAEKALPADPAVPRQGSVNPDSLKREIERIRAEAERLRMQAEAVNDSVAGMKLQPTGDTTANAEKDTVQLLSREGATAFLETLRGKRRGARERGYGGGLGPTPGIFLIAMNPVKRLLATVAGDNKFRDITPQINHSDEAFFLMGLTGYGALGNGFRIGGGFRGGSKSYSTRDNDSTYSLEISVNFGGLLLEKALVRGNVNWFAGGMIGGANVKILPSSASNSLSSMPMEIDEAASRTYGAFNAPAFLLELHGGFTYTMINWFHVGLDLSTPFFFSPSGFRTNYDRSLSDGFATINPGLRIRIILGNIG